MFKIVDSKILKKKTRAHPREVHAFEFEITRI